MPADPPDEAPAGGDEDTGEEPVDSQAGEPADPDGYENGGSTEDEGDAPADANTPDAEDEERTGETEPTEREDSESGADDEEDEDADDSDKESEEHEEDEQDDADEAEGGDDASEADGAEGDDPADEEGDDGGTDAEDGENGSSEGEEDEGDSDAEGEDTDSQAEGETDSEVGDETDSGVEGEDDDESETDDADEGDGDDDESETDDTDEGGGDDDESETDDADEGDGEEEEDDGMVEMHDDTTPIQRKTGGPESDKEQPLADHIEEMIKRLAIVVIVAGVVSLLAFPFGEDFIIFLWYSVLPPDISQPHVYHPLELVITQLKAASLLGLVLALPVFVYETYAFMRPGLFPHERRYYLAAVPTSLILASVGLLFGYFLVLPAVMTYFLYYSRDVVDIAFALGQTFNLMLILLGYLAVVFQIPLFVMLAIMMGLVTRQWLEDRRLIFWGAFLGLSFLFSPDPTGMAPIIVAATMVALFEGTLLLLRWTRHR